MVVVVVVVVAAAAAAAVVFGVVLVVVVVVVVEPRAVSHPLTGNQKLLAPSLQGACRPGRTEAYAAGLSGLLSNISLATCPQILASRRNSFPKGSMY